MMNDLDTRRGNEAQQRWKREMMHDHQKRIGPEIPKR